MTLMMRGGTQQNLNKQISEIYNGTKLFILINFEILIILLLLFLKMETNIHKYVNLHERQYFRLLTIKNMVMKKYKKFFFNN